MKTIGHQLLMKSPIELKDSFIKLHCRIFPLQKHPKSKPTHCCIPIPRSSRIHSTIFFLDVDMGSFSQGFLHPYSMCHCFLMSRCRAKRHGEELIKSSTLKVRRINHLSVKFCKGTKSLIAHLMFVESLLWQDVSWQKSNSTCKCKYGDGEPSQHIVSKHNIHFSSIIIVSGYKYGNQ